MFNRSNVDYSILCAGTVILILYTVGLLYPEPWWGIHFLSFVPGAWKYILLVILAIGVIAASFLSPGYAKSIQRINIARSQWLMMITGVALGMGFLFYSFPIANDIYGDSILLKQSLDTKLDKVPELYLEGLYALDLTPSGGRRTMIGFFSSLVVATGGSYGEVLIWSDVVFGVLFCVLWLCFIHTYLRSAIWLVSFGVMAIGGPFMLIFYGHMEFYAVTYFVQLLWLVTLLYYIKSEKTAYYYMLFPLLLIGLKIHPTTLLLVPALCLVTAHRFREKVAFFSSLLTWRGVLTWVFSPLLVGGAYLYFFIAESYNDDRVLQYSADLDHIFLPLVSPAPPLDRYNMFSFSHFWDFGNAILMWSPAAIFLFVLLFYRYRKEIPWSDISILIVGFTLVLFILFLFTINPLLSMPMDWDLFCLPVIFFLTFMVLLVRRLKEPRLFGTRIAICVIAMTILCVPVVTVNNSFDGCANRLESLGRYIFKTYYEWSETILLTSVGMRHKDGVTHDYIERKLDITDDLKAYAIPGNDTIYAMLLADNGLYYERIEGDLVQARNAYLEANQYQPQSGVIQLKLLEYSFRLEDYNAAYQSATALISIDFPNRPKALRMAIHCAIEASLTARAIEHSEQYLKLVPGDETILNVLTELKDGTSAADVLRYFKHAP